MDFDRDREGLYLWMQGKELEEELKKHYKKIHRIRVFNGNFNIWFLNNEDVVWIPYNTMCSIYHNGKSVERLVRVIDKEYLARIKVLKE